MSLPPDADSGKLVSGVLAQRRTVVKSRGARERRRSAMPVSGFDHVALPTEHAEEMIAFYGRLGFAVPDLENWRQTGRLFFSVHFGNQKINFHAPRLWQDPAFELRGPTARPGCGDLCFVWEGGSEALRALLADAGAELVAGPIELPGARGKGTSVYVRDPDGNLLEFIVYDEERSTA
jgi:catechol 2,3-dioxygenase-like lactoylglutathione lyase family enzyme